MNAHERALTGASEPNRRSYGAHGEGGTRADDSDMAGQESPAASFGGPPTNYHATNYQGSVEPFRRPDHKAKRHGRPHSWAERQQRRSRREREYAA